eukprot:COSAG01_NODE_8472_length_2773_cov_77.844428_3_plen_139_part_00
MEEELQAAQAARTTQRRRMRAARQRQRTSTRGECTHAPTQVTASGHAPGDTTLAAWPNRAPGWEQAALEQASHEALPATAGVRQLRDKAQRKAAMEAIQAVEHLWSSRDTRWDPSTLEGQKENDQQHVTEIRSWTSRY